MNILEDTFESKTWRLENLYPIIDKKAQKQIFSPNEIQTRILNTNAHRKMILKARQFGVSTACILDCFDDTIWNRNTNVCILAHEQDSIEKLFRIPRRAFDYMDPRIRPGIDRGGGSKYEMYFPTINSRIYCDLESRGDTIHRLHISEAAFFKDPNRIKATLQAVPLNGVVTIETTPNGMGNYFYDWWNDPNQPYTKLFFPWFMHHEYQMETQKLEYDDEEKALIEKALLNHRIEITQNQIAFRRYKKNELGPLFIQEYPEDDYSCFISTGNSAIDLSIVKQAIESAYAPFTEDQHLKIYIKPSVQCKYVIGADTAEGIKEDYSVAVVLEATTLVQVAILRGHFKPSEFARKIDELAKMYSPRGEPPLVAVERNNHGHAVLLELNEHIKYPNLFVDKDDKLGFLTDKVSRPIMIDSFIDALEHKRLTIHDKDILYECLNLVSINNKIQAQTGKHDDCIMATAIALQMAIKKRSEIFLYSRLKDKILT